MTLNIVNDDDYFNMTTESSINEILNEKTYLIVVSESYNKSDIKLLNEQFKQLSIKNDIKRQIEIIMKSENIKTYSSPILGKDFTLNETSNKLNIN